MNIVLQLPIKTVSESNSSEHWSTKHKRHKNQKKWVRIVWYKEGKPKIDLPCKVKLTRISPRTLDSDNLQGSLKWIRDAISEIIIPNTLAGRADDHPEISWEYDQQKGKPCVIIEINF